MPITRRIGQALVLNLLLIASPSLAADPTKLECVLASENGQALQHDGKLRAARAQFAICVADACPGPVRADCAQHLVDADNATPTVVFVVTDSAGAERSDVRITMDGQPLVSMLDGRAIPLDAGAHSFVFEAANGETSEKTLLLHEGEKDRRERVVLSPSRGESIAGKPERTGGRQPNIEPSTTEGAASAGDSQRLIGLALGGAGVVGLAVGIVLGLVSRSTYNHALNSECGPSTGFSDPKTCNAGGVHDVQSAYNQATVSTIGFVAAFALLGGGGYLFLSAPTGGHVSAAPTVGAGGLGASLQGRW
jgi:hypothetical protein